MTWKYINYIWIHIQLVNMLNTKKMLYDSYSRKNITFCLVGILVIHPSPPNPMGVLGMQGWVFWNIGSLCSSDWLWIYFVVYTSHQIIVFPFLIFGVTGIHHHVGNKTFIYSLILLSPCRILLLTWLRPSISRKTNILYI